MKPWKRVLAMILTLCLMSTALPVVPALAVEVEPAEETVQPDYAVTRLTVRGTSATVELTAPGDCTLVVALYTEAGAMISTAIEKVSGDAEPQIIPVTVDPKEHTAYTSKAFLLDGESYAPLGETAEEGYAPWTEAGDMASPTEETVAYAQEIEAEYVSDTLIILFDLDATVFEIGEVVESIGGEIIGRDGILKVYQVRVQASSFAELQAMAADVMEEDCVAFATYDLVLRDPSSAVTGVDPHDNWTSEVDETDWLDGDIDGSNWWVEAVEGQKAWAYNDEMEHINIGVVDGSFDVDHEDLAGKAAFADDLMKNRNSTWNAKHGTHVAGIIGAAANNETGITGLVDNSTLLLAPAPSAADGGMSYETIAQVCVGISHVVGAGAKVVNLSIGMSGQISEEKPTYGTFAMDYWGDFMAIWMAQLLDEVGDFVVVQSSGNGDWKEQAVDAVENGFFCFVSDESHTASESTSIQDVLDRILIVGAAEYADGAYQCCEFSNYGTKVDLCAPGKNIYSTIPEVLLEDGYGIMSGTSMAAPIVTGVCAMTWAVNAGLTGAEVKEIVCASTNRTVAPHPEDGSAISYPLVNARLAVEKALAYREGEGETIDPNTDYPVTFTVKYEDGTPAKGVAINEKQTYPATLTDANGMVAFDFKPGAYRFTVTHDGYFGQAVVIVQKATAVEIVLKKNNFQWELDETGTHLTISGWGPMPDYAVSGNGQAPWGKDITSATITGVATIGKNAFVNSFSLAKVTVDDNTALIGDQAFTNCRTLTDITLSEGLFSLGARAFEGCTALVDVNLPDTLAQLNEKCFYDCNSLAAVTVPAWVSSMGAYVFAECDSLMDVIFLSPNTYIGPQAFYNCTALTSFVAPNGVGGVIGTEAFYNCASLEYVSSLKGSSGIGSYAFYGCSSLERIHIPASAQVISRSAFQNCTSLGVVTLSEGLVSIDGSAFANCDALTRIVIPSTVTTMGSQNYTGCFSDCDGLTSVVILGQIKNLPDGCFSSCDSLREVSLPESLRTVGRSAFGYCIALQEIELPNRVTTLSGGVFSYCSALESVTLSENLTTLGPLAFKDCTSLANIEIPNNVTTIDNMAFEGCGALEWIVFPDSLTTIGTKAFYNCTSLRNAYLPAGVTTIGERAFENCSAMEELDLPNTVTSIKDYAFKGCKSITEVTIPGSLDYRHMFGHYLFENCKGLESATFLPGSTRVPGNMFHNCTELVSITIPDTITAFNASDGCNNLTDIYYGGTQEQWTTLTNGYYDNKYTIHFGV